MAVLEPNSERDDSILHPVIQQLSILINEHKTNLTMEQQFALKTLEDNIQTLNLKEAKEATKLALILCFVKQNIFTDLAKKDFTWVKEALTPILKEENLTSGESFIPI